MKKCIITILLLGSLINCRAQYKTGIFIAQNFSSFRFMNSDKQISNPGYVIKSGYGFVFQKEIADNFYAEGILLYNNVGASSNVSRTKLEWSFHYINAVLEGGCRFFQGRFSPIAGAGLYYGRLLKADQLVGSLYYDLMSGNSVKKNDFGPVVFAGIEYKYSNKFMESGVVFARVNGWMGLLNLEDYKTVSQKMFTRALSIQTGILFSFRL